MNIKHIIQNNFRALRLVKQITPSLFFVSLIKSIILATIDPLLTIWYFKYMIDSVMVSKRISEILIVTAIICLLVVSKQIFISWYDKVFYPLKSLTLRKKMREKLYRKLTEIDISNYDDNESYEKINRAMREVDNRLLAVYNTFFSIIESSVILITSLSIVLQIDLYILFFSILSLIVSIIFNVSYNKINYDLNMSQVYHNRKIDYVHRVLNLKDYSQDVRTTKLPILLFDMMDNAFNGLNKTYREKKNKLMQYDVLPQSITLVSTILSIFYIIIRISMGQITVGSFAALLNGSQSVTATISGLFQFIPSFQQHSMYLDNLYEVLDKHETIISGNRKVLKEDIYEIEFSNVSFRYPNGEQYVLKNLSFKVKAGEKIGIVGHNGAGKTTLIKLLLRLYDPTEGDIFLNGLNYKQYDLKSLREVVGTVFQNYFVYPFPIYENVSLGFADIKQRSEIDSILRDINLYEKINGLDSEMEKQLSNEFENGLELSRGEQQKVSIARVLFNSYPIVVMDEPSSALDPQSEAEIVSLISKKFRTNTVFIVSHRLSTTKMCDNIIHIANGTIIECGSHEQLMAGGGEYSRLYNLQAENYTNNSGKELVE